MFSTLSPPKGTYTYFIHRMIGIVEFSLLIPTYIYVHMRNQLSLVAFADLVKFILNL